MPYYTGIELMRAKLAYYFNDFVIIQILSDQLVKTYYHDI